MQCCYRWLNLLCQTLLHSHCSNTVNISTVVILGFWFCHFNTSSLAWGLCLLLTTKFLVWCSSLIYVVLVTVGGVWGSNFIGCSLCHLMKGRLIQGFCYLSVSHFFVPHFDVSARRLKCTKHMGLNSSVVQWRIYVGTENRWAKEIRWEGVSQIMLKIVMKPHVLLKTGNWMNSWATVGFSGRAFLCNNGCYSL